jgi:hypothetical protein
MAAHREVHVVVVEGVAGRTVDQRRSRGQHGLGPPDQRRGAFRPVLQGFGDQDPGEFFLRSGDRDGEPVE